MSRLTNEEQQALRYASGTMVPMERLELLDFLGYPETLSHKREERVVAVVERILERRGFSPIT